jgi:hypothetical protein
LRVAGLATRVRGAAALGSVEGAAVRVREAAGLRAGAFAGGFSSAGAGAAASSALDGRVVDARVVDRAAGLRVVAGLRVRAGAGGVDVVPSAWSSIVAIVSVTFGLDSATTVDSTPASSDSSRLRSAVARVAGRLAAGVVRFAGVVDGLFGVDEAVRPVLARVAGDRRGLAFFSGVSEDSVLSEGGRSKLTPLTYQDGLVSARLCDEVQWFHTESRVILPPRNHL